MLYIQNINSKQVMKTILQINFISLLLNMLLVSFIFFTKYENIAKSSVQTSGYDNAVAFVDAFLITSLVMIGLQIIMTIFGLPFSKEPLAVQILLQILGVIGYGMFILSRMHYVTISYIWGVFCLLPFAISILSLIFKSISYRKYSLLNYSEDPHRNQQNL